MVAVEEVEEVAADEVCKHHTLTEFPAESNRAVILQGFAFTSCLIIVLRDSLSNLCCKVNFHFDQG